LKPFLVLGYLFSTERRSREKTRTGIETLCAEIDQLLGGSQQGENPHRD